MSTGDKNIVIVGAGVAGRLLARDIRKRTNHRVVGFVDDRVDRRGVIGDIDELSRLVDDYEVDEMIVAIPSADGALIRKVLGVNKGNNIPIRLVPRAARVLKTNEVNYQEVKDIEAEDFLGRAIVSRNIQKSETFYQSKKILVTGGAGSIGSEIVRQLLELRTKKVIVYDHAEHACYKIEQELVEGRVPKKRWQVIVGSILNSEKFEYVVGREKPDMIFHAAAYKHVHLMENNIGEAVSTNIFGTKAVADTAVKYEVKRLVFVSTDKVVRPTSVMGATKNVAEAYVRSLVDNETIISVVRFGNVINSQGSVLPLFEEQIKRHRYVTVTDRRMKRFFMSIREAAELVILSASRSSRGAVYVLDMGDLVSVCKVAECLIRSKNLRPEVDVGIKYVGMKAGEKIKEELFTRKERAKITRTRMLNIWKLKNSHDVNNRGFDILSELDARRKKWPNDRRLRKYLSEVFPLLSK